MKKDTKDFLEIAEDNLIIAKKNFEDKIYRSACFWAQQAAELFIKAYMVEKEIFDPKKHITHDLFFLIKECSKKDKDFEKLFDFERELAMLSKFATTTRYVIKEIKRISEQEAKEAIEIAEKVKEFVMNKLKEKLE
ncbi:MAG: HEPN domain-containing protein [Candidatus Aenigmatarchaeota archaeon]